MAHSAVTRYLREANYSALTGAAPSINIFMVTDVADYVILAALDKTLFVFIRHLSRLTHLSIRDSLQTADPITGIHGSPSLFILCPIQKPANARRHYGDNTFTSWTLHGPAHKIHL
jgi:hypothetical protein